MVALKPWKKMRKSRTTTWTHWCNYENASLNDYKKSNADVIGNWKKIR